LFVGWCEQKTIRAASSSGSTPDLTSLGLAAAAAAVDAVDADAGASVSEKFYQQAAAGQSVASVLCCC